MDLSVVIVNYKDKDKLTNCLASFAVSGPVLSAAGLSYEILVVENNSGDDLSALEKSQPHVKLIVSRKNLGMGGGNNLGIGQAQGEYILILNPDTVVNASAILILWNYLKANPAVGLIGPKLLYPDASLQYSCSRFPVFFMPILRRTFLGDYFKEIRDSFTMNNFDHNSIRTVGWLMGSCFMFKRQLQLPEGGVFEPRFDERYFMYFEDTDLCREIWTKGLSVVYNPEAIIIHDHARESAKYPWYLAIFKDGLAWIHIISWLKYFYKWGLKTPKHLYE